MIFGAAVDARLFCSSFDGVTTHVCEGTRRRVTPGVANGSGGTRGAHSVQNALRHWMVSNYFFFKVHWVFCR